METTSVIILNGFLGAGKTTLLKNLLIQAHEKQLSVSVIVNDMSELDVDGVLIANTDIVDAKDNNFVSITADSISSPAGLRFIRNGGEIKCISQLSDKEISSSYISLFHSRFGGTLPCYEYDNLLMFISHLRELMFGHVLFWDNKPCAIDIVLKSESSCNVYYDVPNGAVLNDENCMKLSPGSVLMWLNIDKARRYCQDNNKKMIYSIGAFRPEWKYKLLWSVPCKVGKCLC
ncbi:antimicrobial resistance protein Mig-14 [Salmonella enterica]|nr:antimicrobial resistance protein Mig-14 [Salmonella enterica]ECG1131784.1 antimicrobial resistance protein Mig-14 [Salmonella enterica subsp. enterica]EBD5631967.1 antimicrobial resistance protein Mig-14 [Salmonella enterica]ECS8937344.1 antimicrobial resistance protein Mig-14 [Salmonella enterica]EDR9039437.1 antimicrobial resistance protein Mig-14 [Salmonella enterica subsp. enterica]